MRLHIARTLLLEVDVQNDFFPAYDFSGKRCPDGVLAVPDGGAVVAPLNALASAFARGGGRVAATQDWHPPGHVSFASSRGGVEPPGGPSGQVLWPDHCVMGTRGADFHAGLDLGPVNLIVRKGFRPELDSYSAFFENDGKTPTGLEGWMRGLGIDTVAIGGVATDYCVFHSAMDSQKLGFATIIVEDAVRGVDIPSGSLEKAVSQMREAGIAFCGSAKILEGLV